MNPSKHSRSLWFTPRTSWGRLPQNRPGQNQNYLRASENENDRELPEEDKKGAIQGKIEISGGKNQGKTDAYGQIQYNSNPGFSEPTRFSDPGKEGRDKLNAERANALVSNDKERQRKVQQQSQKEVENYVNKALSTADDTAAYFKLPQGQARPAR